MRAARARSSPSVCAAQQQLGHHGQLHLVHAEPLVEVVAVFGDPAVALHQPHRAELAEPLERLLHLLGLELHDGEAVALLVGGRGDGVERHGVGTGDGLGLFHQDAGDAAVDGVDAAASAGAAACCAEGVESFMGGLSSQTSEV